MGLTHSRQQLWHVTSTFSRFVQTYLVAEVRANALHVEQRDRADVNMHGRFDTPNPGSSLGGFDTG